MQAQYVPGQYVNAGDALGEATGLATRPAATCISENGERNYS